MRQRFKTGFLSWPRFSFYIVFRIVRLVAAVGRRRRPQREARPRIRTRPLHRRSHDKRVPKNGTTTGHAAVARPYLGKRAGDAKRAIERRVAFVCEVERKTLAQEGCALTPGSRLGHCFLLQKAQARCGCL